MVLALKVENYLVDIVIQFINVNYSDSIKVIVAVLSIASLELLAFRLLPILNSQFYFKHYQLDRTLYHTIIHILLLESFYNYLKY